MACGDGWFDTYYHSRRHARGMSTPPPVHVCVWFFVRLDWRETAPIRVAEFIIKPAVTTTSSFCSISSSCLRPESNQSDNDLRDIFFFLCTAVNRPYTGPAVRAAHYDYFSYSINRLPVIDYSRLIETVISRHE